MPTETLPLTVEDRGLWKQRLTQAEKLRDDQVKVWEEAIQAYLGKRLSSAPTRDEVVVNKEFSFVELKKAQLLFQVPEIALKPRWPGLESAVALFQAALNHELGPDAANVKIMLSEVLFDVLTCGIAVSKIGYASTVGTKQVQQPVMDPISGQPIPDPMTGQPAMTMQEVPTLIHEEWFWRRVSPDAFLLPAEFQGLDFDEAPWLAWQFTKDLEQAKRDYDLPKDFRGKTVDPFKTLSGEKDGLAGSSITPVVKGTEIWYKAAQFDSKEPHPERIRCLVLIEGHEEPIKHQDSPYQFVGKDGKLHGMRGFPLHILTLRTVAGSAYPPSDVSLGLGLSEELSRGRSQMVRQRDTSIPLRGFDRNRIDPDTAAKLIAGNYGGLVPMDGPLMDGVWEIARAQWPRENFTFNEVIDRDYEELWALGRSLRGIGETEGKTATEINVMASAADTRLDYERQRVLEFFVTGVRKFAALLQMFADDPRYVEVLGPQAQGLQAWDRSKIQGEFLFSAKPDTALRIDANAERKQALDLYNLTANDPNVNRIELLKSVIQKHNLDPSRIVVAEVPEKQPEPPKVTISVSAADLAMPSPLLLKILEQYQIEVLPEGMEGPGEEAEGPEMPHGGAAEEQSPLNKHLLRGPQGAM